ncbi:hypothetical protein IE81DRAFT_125608 [Ceraceosorus guamensis]|uniref:Uncharacterized protein n=1 Tax=Ceraceosorus guamensis TaxID=1522189 RepID=A0A316W068_9BASI|nr:hypothetical protein IE81DRAFT_125608 [Ceraceosorus guamensis]PWN42518.1 hypothetical protein IE81DRAFT_125608 [Ceraceosorus guamensis]
MVAATAIAASRLPSSSDAPVPPTRKASFTALSQLSSKSGSNEIRGSSGDSSSSSSSSSKGLNAQSSSSKLSVNGQPSSPNAGGILTNAHEKPALTRRALSSNSGTGATIASAFKTAFQPPPQAGKQAKKTGLPLGKSFERTTPLGSDGSRHVGAEVLPYDPRGEEASAGDGVLPPTRLDIPQGGWHVPRKQSASEDAPSSSSSERPPPLTSSSDFSNWVARDDSEQVSEDVAEPASPASAHHSSASETSDGARSWKSGSTAATTTDEALRRGSVASTSTNASSGSSNHSCAIRFAPLPSSGRLKRANSITIGVAARSHLLSSQGSARSNAADWQSAQLHAPGGPAGNGNNARQAWYNGGAKPDDVVDIGEELRKGALKAWRKVRGNGAPPSPAAAAESSKSSTAGGQTLQAPSKGDATPRRSASPTSDEQTTDHHQTDHVDGGQPSTFHQADEDLGEGAQTPRARRLSTGAFLGSSSLRGMQEDRRKEVLGLEGEGGGEDEGADSHEAEQAQDEEEGSIVAFQKGLGRTNAGKVASRLFGFGAETEAPSRDELTGQQQQDATLADSGSESVDSSDSGRIDEEDEETREAQALADQAFTAHSEKALKAGGIEKQRRKVDQRSPHPSSG